MTSLGTRPATFTEVVAGAIAAQGVTHAFGLMGAGTIRLTHHLKTDHGVRYHGARHETASVGAADGYARVTGDVGVALITWGPALTHALTDLITAQRGASSLVLVAGDSSRLDPAVSPFSAHTQRLEQERLLATLGFLVVRATPALGPESSPEPTQVPGRTMTARIPLRIASSSTSATASSAAIRTRLGDLLSVASMRARCRRAA